MSGGARKGFSLIELIVVIGIAAAVGGLISGTLSREQRVFRATTESLAVRRSVRDALMIVAEEIRGASARDTVRLMSDSSIELFTTVGSSVACTQINATDIGLAPASQAGIALTSWLSTPDTGDIAMVYRSASSTAGVWERYRIGSVSSRATTSACPAATGLAGGAGVSASSYVLTLSPAPSTVMAGAPVRLLRRGRYSLYRSSDGKWYLGYRRCNAIGLSSCGTVQPLSGYYRAYSSDTSRTGILFRYVDRDGRQLSAGDDPTRIARIEIVARAVSPIAVMTGANPTSAADSATISIALRNPP